MPLSPTDTVTVAGHRRSQRFVAVTVTDVADAPSLTLDGAADSVNGATSSSVMVTVVSRTEVLDLVPDTVRVSSHSTSFSSVGVRVKVPVAELLFCGMVIVKSSTGS